MHANKIAVSDGLQHEKNDVHLERLDYSILFVDIGREVNDVI
jgi:hypothetical protein